MSARAVLRGIAQTSFDGACTLHHSDDVYPHAGCRQQLGVTVAGTRVCGPVSVFMLVGPSVPPRAVRALADAPALVDKTDVSPTYAQAVGIHLQQSSGTANSALPISAADPVSLSLETFRIRLAEDLASF